MKHSELSWGNYAKLFAQITTPFQRELYNASASYLFGDVVDCGCGAAKLAPHLMDNPDINSYLGLDADSIMVRQARELLKRLGRPTFRVRRQAIEHATGTYSCAVSLQSYYSWSDANSVLTQIYCLLNNGSRFVIATPNRRLDIEHLLQESAKDLLMYPGWQRYASMNRGYASNARLVSLDTLVDEVKCTGFRLLDVRTDMFSGGINFLVLQK